MFYMRGAMNILVLCVSGVLGHTLFMYLFSFERHFAWAVDRNLLPFKPFFLRVLYQRIFSGVDVGKLGFVMDR